VHVFEALLPAEVWQAARRLGAKAVKVELKRNFGGLAGWGERCCNNWSWIGFWKRI